MAKSKATTSSKDSSTGQLVYDRAVDLIYEYGFHGTSLRPIAERVGVQMSTLYHYFPSKQEILVTIMTVSMQDMTDQVRTAIDGTSEPRASLKAAVGAHIAFHVHRLKEAMIADSELRSLEPPARKRIVAMRDDYEGIFRSIVEAGQMSGDFRDVNPTLAVRALLGAITYVGNWYRPNGPLSLEEISSEYCRVYLEGIGAHDSQSKTSRKALANLSSDR